MKQEEGKMELFEEVGQTLSRTGQGLAQKRATPRRSRS